MSNIDVKLGDDTEQSATQNLRLKCDRIGESLPLASAGKPSSATPSPRGSAPKTPGSHTDSILLTQNQKKLNCIDLFCGCGGLSKGFLDAGYNVLLGIDFDDAALKSFEKNHGGAKALKLDLFNLDNIQEIENFLHENNTTLDVLISGPPCQGFSLAGKREENDKRNILYTDMVKTAEKLRPKVILLEKIQNN